VFRGMDMNGKKKFLSLGLLPVVALVFFLHDLWSCPVCVVGQALASAVLVLLVFSKVLAGIAGIHFLL
jgi:hypothetical protein